MKNFNKELKKSRGARARRARAKLTISAKSPRLSVFRSLKHIGGQIIDAGGKVIASASDIHLKDKKLKGVARATATGLLLAEQAKSKKITTVVFDKGRYKYHGQVKAFAEGARKGGLIF